MGLSSNIITHELDGYGDLRINEQTSVIFEDVRLFFNKSLLQRKDVLYICDDPNVPSMDGCEGFSFLYVGANSSRHSNCAMLSLVRCELSGSAILSVLQDLLLKYRLWEEAMSKSVANDEGIQSLINLSEGVLPNHVVVLDAALKLLANTNKECDDPITVELIKHGYHTEDNISKFKLNKRFKPWSTEDGFIINDTKKICRYTTAAYSFKNDNMFSLIIVMMCNEKEPEPWVLDTASKLIDRIGVYAKRDYSSVKPAGVTVDAFLRDLVSGATTDPKAIQERCEFAGIPFEARFCLFAIPLKWEGPIARLLADVATMVAPAKTFLHDNNVVVLCFNCMTHNCTRNCLVDKCPRKRTTVSQRLNETLEEYGLICGRSSTFTKLTEAHWAFVQAKDAARMHEMRLVAEQYPDLAVDVVLRGPRRKNIYPFDKYSFETLMRDVYDTHAGVIKQTWSYQLLERIHDNDAKTNMDNYEFLFSYIANERRASVVADELHMHRNNVKYRIDKIEQQYEIDTSDAGLRLELLTAYRYRKAIDVMDKLHG